MIPISNNQQSRGAAAIYLVLLLTFMFTSSALIISFSLSRQLRATSEIADSARAFYAATSGLEQGLMQLVTNPAPDTVITAEDSIRYEDDEQGSYTATGRFVPSDDDPNVFLPCVSAEGDFNNQQRRAELGRGSCGD